MKEEDITKKQDTEFWATNAEQGGWTVTSTDEGSQKMKIEEFMNIPIVRKYKYLGYEINEKIDNKDMNERRNKAIEKSIKMLKIMNM